MQINICICMLNLASWQTCISERQGEKYSEKSSQVEMNTNCLLVNITSKTCWIWRLICCWWRWLWLVRCKVKQGLPPFFNVSSHVSMPRLLPLALSTEGEWGIRGCSQSVCPCFFFLLRISPCPTVGSPLAVWNSLSTWNPFSSLSWSFSSVALHCVQSSFLVLCSSLSAAMRHLKPFLNLLSQRHHHVGCWA